ncbi:MAG: CDP-diacylglycerol--glycerol-3-phosphate 3-phosphatidyltransferase [Lachnospirales bacterium]
MNLPNKLTILRVLLVPFFLYFLLAEGGSGNTYKLISLSIFIIASATDYFDGYLARKHNLITNFGKFMDPIADKLLVNSAIIALLYNGEIGVVATIIIICRELIISGFRLVAVTNNVVIAAGQLGKWKTVIQMIMVVCLLSGVQHINDITSLIGTILIYASVLLSVVSCVDYIWKNKEVLKG